MKLNCASWSHERWSKQLEFPENQIGFGMNISFVEDLASLLDKERELCVDNGINYVNKSYLSLISSCDVRVHRYAVNHFMELTEKPKPKLDHYIANVLKFVAKHFKQVNCNPEFFIRLTILLSDQCLPITQNVAAHALALKDCDNLLSILSKYLAILDRDDICQNTRRTSEVIIVQCLLGLSQKNLLCDDTTLNDVIVRCVQQSKSVVVSTHAIACYFTHSHVKVHMRTLSNVWDVYNLDRDSLYRVLIINAIKHSIQNTHKHLIELILEDWDHFIGTFVAELCEYMTCNLSSLYFRPNPQTDYLGIATALSEKNREKFCQAIRSSDFGEEKFKSRLYDIGMCDDDRYYSCVHLYEAFGVLTSKFIELLFNTHQEKVLTSFPINRIELAESRDAIESLFQHLKSSSLNKRVFAAQLLVHLAEINLISAFEAQELIGLSMNDPTLHTIDNVDEFESSINTFLQSLRQLLLKLTCIERVENDSYKLEIPNDKNIDGNFDPFIPDSPLQICLRVFE